MSAGFPADFMCHASGCRKEAVETLVADGGGWVARFCQPHFDSLERMWSSNRRLNEARFPSEGSR